MNRADGTKLKLADPMYKIASYVMDKRTDAMNMITIDVPIEPVQAYINKKRNEDGINISHMAVIIAAYLRTVAEFPMLNRFIVNCKAYSRNEFTVAMVVLKAGQVDHGTMSKMYFDFENILPDEADFLSAEGLFSGVGFDSFLAEIFQRKTLFLYQTFFLF